MPTITLPEEIRDYINSGKAISEIDEIAERVDMYHTRPLYKVIFGLIRKEFPAEEFINELSREIGWDKEVTLSMAHEVKEKVLQPIKYSLKDWGVDVEKIETPNPTPLEKFSTENMLKQMGIEVGPEEELKEAKPTETAQIPISQTKTTETEEVDQKQDTELKEAKPTEKRIDKKPTPRPEQPAQPKIEEKTKDKEEELKQEGQIKPQTKSEKGGKSDKPFMIHKESKPTDFQRPKDKEEKKKSKRKKSFSFSTDGFFDEDNKDKKDQSPRANVETPGQKDSRGFFGFGTSKKKEENKRVVHYSGKRSSLDKEDGGGFINLSNLEPSSNKKEQKTDQDNKNKDESNQRNKENDNNKGPKIGGNTIDLKDN